MAKLIPVDEFDLVIFGGTGDLAMRKLLPALYHRDRDGQFTGESRIIAASRGDIGRDDYLARVEEALTNLHHWIKWPGHKDLRLQSDPRISVGQTRNVFEIAAVVCGLGRGQIPLWSQR